MTRWLAALLPDAAYAGSFPRERLRERRSGRLRLRRGSVLPRQVNTTVNRSYVLRVPGDLRGKWISATLTEVLYYGIVRTNANERFSRRPRPR